MNGVTIYSNAEFGDIRTIETAGGKVLFCGKDIASALGYKRSADAIREHCKGVCEMPTPSSGGTQNMKYITEGDVYRLITHSRLPEAERFEAWVFDEVLPSIRRHGAYMTPDVLEQTIKNPDFIIGICNELKAEQERRRSAELTVSVQAQQIAELQPKASYYDVILNCKDLISVSEIAKDYGRSAMWLNKLLHDMGVQFRQGDIWLLYQKYAEKGYTSTKTQTFNSDDGRVHSKVHTYWTQKGRLFIYGLLKENGILPLIERK